MSLKNRALSGVRWTAFSSISRAALQFAQLAILARLLMPSDFGLMALLVAITSFLKIFADAGVSNAIIHRQDISDKQLSSLYWLNVSLSLLIALILVSVSNVIANWYDQPELKYMLWMAATSLLVTALAQQLSIVAQKRLWFKPLSIIELVSALAGFSIGVISALAGAGVYSLVMVMLGTSITSTILLWVFVSKGWRPELRMHFHEIKTFLKFGAYMMGNNLANTFNSQVDVLLGTKLLGAQAIGLYSVPKNLNLRIAGIINPIVTKVGMPVMAESQGDLNLLKRIYLKTMLMTASVNFPIYLSLAVFSPEVVGVLLGPKWEESTVLLQIFSIWALFRSTGNPIGSLLMARGRADLSFNWNILWLLILPPTIWYGSQFGITGMALAMTTLGILGYWPNWFFLVRPLCEASFTEYSVQMLMPLVSSIVAIALAYIVVGAFENMMLRLIVAMCVVLPFYILASYVFNREWFFSLKELVMDRDDKREF